MIIPTSALKMGFIDRDVDPSPVAASAASPLIVANNLVVPAPADIATLSWPLDAGVYAFEFGWAIDLASPDSVALGINYTGAGKGSMWMFDQVPNGTLRAIVTSFQAFAATTNEVFPVAGTAFGSFRGQIQVTSAGLLSFYVEPHGGATATLRAGTYGRVG